MAQQSQSIFALGLLQTNFTTEQAIANDTYRMFAKEGYDPAEYGNTRANNAGFANGSPYPSRSRIARHESGLPFSYPLSYEGLLFLAIMSFGDYEVETILAPSGGDPGVFKHTFRLLNPKNNGTLPSRPLADKNGEDAIITNIRDRRFPSMTMQEIAFVRSQGDDYFRANGTLRGSGQKIRPSAVQFFGTGKDVIDDDTLGEFEDEIVPGSFVISLYPQANQGGTAFDIDPCDLKDLSLNINENLNTEIGYGCPRYQVTGNSKSGLIRGQLPPGNQEAGASFSLVNSPDLVDEFDPEDKHETNELFSAKFESIGSTITGAHKNTARFLINQCRIGELTAPSFDGVEGVGITCAMEAQGNVMPLTLEVISDVPNATTFVGKTA